MSVAIVVCVGQSNERGTGGAGTAGVTEFGPPHRDPIKPNGNEYSMWPAMVDKLATFGVRAIVRNTAVGSSSIVRAWCGGCRTWQADRYTGLGEWCLPTVPNGYKYKNIFTANETKTSFVEPIWPTTVGATVTEGSLIWSCLVADANDLSGHVYIEGESGFDPRGQFAALEAQCVGAFDHKLAIIQIGQSDALCVTSRDEFRDGHISAANWLLARGFRVFIGLSWCNPGYAPIYPVRIQPGKDDALSLLSGNEMVHPGVDMYSVFGADPGTQSGGSHVYPNTLDAGGRLWAECIAGRIA